MCAPALPCSGASVKRPAVSTPFCRAGILSRRTGVSPVSPFCRAGCLLASTAHGGTGLRACGDRQHQSTRIWAGCGELAPNPFRVPALSEAEGFRYPAVSTPFCRAGSPHRMGFPAVSSRFPVVVRGSPDPALVSTEALHTQWTAWSGNHRRTSTTA
jgi:hypothetical protein